MKKQKQIDDLGKRVLALESTPTKKGDMRAKKTLGKVARDQKTANRQIETLLKKANGKEAKSAGQ